MRSLELKTLQIKDDIPLYVTLDSLSTWDKNEINLLLEMPTAVYIHQFIC